MSTNENVRAGNANVETRLNVSTNASPNDRSNATLNAVPSNSSTELTVNETHSQGSVTTTVQESINASAPAHYSDQRVDKLIDSFNLVE